MGVLERSMRAPISAILYMKSPKAEGNYREGAVRRRTGWLVMAGRTGAVI